MEERRVIVSKINYEKTERKLLAKSKSISVFIEDDDYSPILYINLIGDVLYPDAYGNEIFSIIEGEIRKRPIVYFTIESDGGSLDTFNMFETLLNRNADLIITETSGRAMSCGFLLWSLGHIRLTREESVFMIHRESFGYYAKTHEIKEHVDFIKNVYDKKINKIYSDMGIDAKEIEKSKYTEIWKSGEFFIKNGIAHNVEDFDIKHFILKPAPIVSIGSHYYMIDSSTSDFRMIRSLHVDSEFISYEQVIYNEMSEIAERKKAIQEELLKQIEREEKNKKNKARNKKMKYIKKQKIAKQNSS